MRHRHQRVEGRQRVVKTAVEKPEPDDQRRIDPLQAFLEIGAVLLINFVKVHALISPKLQIS